jgi:hypothetical protein
MHAATLTSAQDMSAGRLLVSVLDESETRSGYLKYVGCCRCCLAQLWCSLRVGLVLDDGRRSFAKVVVDGHERHGIEVFKGQCSKNVEGQ